MPAHVGLYIPIPMEHARRTQPLLKRCEEDPFCLQTLTPYPRIMHPSSAPFSCLAVDSPLKTVGSAALYGITALKTSLRR